MELRYEDKVLATNLHEFFKTNPYESVKSVAEVLGFPIKNGRAIRHYRILIRDADREAR